MERLGPEAERYLRSVVEGQPIWVRAELEEELRGHLAEAIQRRVREGMDPVQAEREAIDAFGPADELRQELKRVRRAGGVSDRLLRALANWYPRLPFDLLSPWKLVRGRPMGNFQRDYSQGRYDAIIARGEHELRTRGPRFNLHHELGMAYNAIGDYERALAHLHAEVAWVEAHPLPRFLGGAMASATAYCNLAGVLVRLERWDEVDAAIEDGLRGDPLHGMLHLMRAQRMGGQGHGAEVISELRAFLDDHRIVGREKVLLLFAQDPQFDAVRQDPGFQRLVLRAAAS